MKETEKSSGSSVVANLDRREKFKYVLIAEGTLIGFITGALISVFRLMLTGADRLRGILPAYVKEGGLPAALLCALVLIAIAMIVSWLLGREPDIAGSGIPQVEAELRGQKDMCWWRVIAAKMAGCALAIGGGLALGREGPSIQLGSMVGKGVARAGHRLLTEERLLITCGAGAGLSAAFGAPLAGAIFSLEELHRNFSAEVLLTTMAASAAGDFVVANVLGLTPVFGADCTWFAEAELVLVCRKLYQAPVKPEYFLDKALMEDMYPDRDFHDLYIGEIVEVWVPDDTEG
jgi:H+/Cl- antiporter ClcA